jgi:ribosome-associated protein
MEDMLSATENQIAELLREHNGQDVSVLDLRGINNWTDFFIIATVSSKTHMDGLERHIKEFCREREIEIIGSSRKSTDEQWRLLDLGSVIVHLMTADVRGFYELERLWSPIPAANPSYSSKSSQSSSSSSSKSSSSSSS